MRYINLPNTQLNALIDFLREHRTESFIPVRVIWSERSVRVLDPKKITWEFRVTFVGDPRLMALIPGGDIKETMKVGLEGNQLVYWLTLPPDTNEFEYARRAAGIPKIIDAYIANINFKLKPHNQRLSKPVI